MVNLKSCFKSPVLAERFVGGKVAFAVVGLGPHPTDPDGRTEAERLAVALEALKTRAPDAQVVLCEGSYDGEAEPGLLVYGCDWPGEVAADVGSAIGQESVFVHVPGCAAWLLYCRAFGKWAPLGYLRRGPNVDGDGTRVKVRGGDTVEFHA